LSVGDCLQEAVDQLVTAGASIEEKKPDINFIDCHRIYTDLLNLATVSSIPPEQFEEMKKTAATLSEDDQSNYANNIRSLIRTHREWQALNYQRTMMRQKWADYFRDIDVLLCPVSPVAAFPHDQQTILNRTLPINNSDVTCLDALLPWAGLTCVSYLPATVAPVGFTLEGLPVGVQIVGPYLEDLTPIHVAKLMEEVTGGFTPPPGF